ncbi:TPA: hypothetical protein ACPZI4_000626 [Yersinia enterocolitica]
MLSKEPVRIRRDWNVAVVGYCDFCSHSEMTVPHADGGRICASCCDSEFLSSWQNYARSLATELLSLREQLAELKRVPPSFYVLKTAHAYAWGDACGLRCYEDETDASNAKDDFGGVIIQLFTAAKPAED